eukprot:NODE_915_length_1692_cov_30.808278_g748_i0.p1 GENE.NODE_915_length_1692_cov_30.808278_g748_i0~~NODE_915_length_1692_cov_30.808278_g748_i0.p1  ORF type:complete len:323 (-),score=51.68 NODE_915_length_1692_cov_30.808278_g748_i0:119-1087(-)
MDFDFCPSDLYGTPALDKFVSGYPVLSDAETVHFGIKDDPSELCLAADHKGLTAVIDLDETLVDGRSGIIVLRPFALWILDTLASQGVRIVLWSAGLREHVERCVALLDPGMKYVLGVVCRGAWMGCPASKDLALLPNCAPQRTVLVDNSPFAASRQSAHGVIVPDFRFKEAGAASDRVLETIANEVLLPLHRQLLADQTASASEFLANSNWMAFQTSFVPGLGAVTWNRLIDLCCQDSPPATPMTAPASTGPKASLEDFLLGPGRPCDEEAESGGDNGDDWGDMCYGAEVELPTEDPDSPCSSVSQCECPEVCPEAICVEA